MQNVTTSPIGEIFGDYLLEYGAYVNQDRAIPDIRDGLKPVHRRLLISMKDEGMKLTGKRKSAAVIGTALGSYHPHGDSATYGALVGLAHRRYPLIDTRGNWGHGNCGILWEPAAAYRYTECTFSKLGLYALNDLDVCDMQPNFDGTKMEPVVLAARVPLLLMNGSEGIGVAARTSIPPGNLTELAKGLKWLIAVGDRAKTSAVVHAQSMAEALVKRLKGPDYGTGVMISKPAEVARLYANGNGTLRYRCEYHFEEGKRGQQLLIITGLAPGFKVPTFLKFCADEAEAGHIVSAADESGEHTRVVVRFKDAGPVMDRIIPKLRTSLSYNLVTVRSAGGEVAGDYVPSKPQTSNMMTLMLEYLDHQRDVETRVLERDYRKAEAEADRLRALMAAARKIDKVTAVLKRGLDRDETAGRLMDLLKVTEEQAHMILRAQLFSLSRMSLEATEAKVKELQEEMARIEDDLTDIDNVLLRRLDEIVNLFGDERQTKLPDATDDPTLAGSSPSKVMLLKEKKGKWEITRPLDDDSLTGLKKLFAGRRKIDADHIMQAGDQFYIVYSDGFVRTVKWAYINDGPHPEWNRDEGEIVGFISDLDDLILAADGTGKVAVVETRQSLETYQIAKVEQVTSVIGLREGESATVYGLTKTGIEKGRTRNYEWWAAKKKRRNVNPSGVLPHCQLANLVRLRDDSDLVRLSGEGHVLPLRNDPKRMNLEEGYWTIYEDSLVVYADGRKRRKPSRLVRNSIRRGEEILHILPMTDWTDLLDMTADEEDEE